MTGAVAKTRDFSRLDRVGATVRKVLAEPVNELARTRGAGLASITDVELSPDLRRGTVHLSVYGGTEAQEAFVRLLNERAPALQGELARALRTRRVPVLTFRLDDSIARSDRIQRLLGPGGDDGGR
jgi:ribosome-binding factor A